MDDTKPRHPGQWAPGQSGNPSGRPKIVGEVQELARKATPDAIATLKRIAKDKKAPPAAQVSAAIALLDRAWGRPHQSMDVAVSRSFDEMSDAELAAIAYGADEEKPTSVN
jgi:Family of unknown function (DUF5681)